jgi:integrase
MSPRPRNEGSKDLAGLNLYRKLDKRNGKTYYTYRDPVSGRCFGLGTDKDTAIREAVAANHALYNKPVALAERVSAAPAVPARLFSEWLIEYRAIYQARGLAPVSVENARMRINRLDAAFGGMDIRQITTMDVAKYLGAMAKAGKAQMSRAMRSLLRDVFMEAVAAGWTASNPVEVTKAARVKIKRQRLTLELWKATYGEAKQAWLKRAMELAVLTGQRREDIAGMLFKDEREGFLHVVQSKTGARLRISTGIRLEALGLDLAGVIKGCRDRVVSKHLIHHARTISKAKAGQRVVLDTISKEFAAARDRAAIALGMDLGESPPTFHEMRSLAARLHAAEGRDPQALLGHRHAKMTDLYRDSRGAEWIDVA